jgi:hypothetical protein
MCTVLFHRELNLLCKNRDKTRSTEEELLQDSNFVAVRTKGASYFSLGMNRNGVAFVSTAINTPKWTAAAARGLHQEAQEQFQRENEGLSSPTAELSRTLSEVASINEWVELIKSSGKRWMGYNLVLADRHSAKVLEVHGDRVHERDLSPKAVVTNHFLHVVHGPRVYEDYPSTFERLKLCESEMPKVQTLEQAQAILKSSAEEEPRQIWRFGNFATVSSTILDLRKLGIYYTDNLERPYKLCTLK